MMTSQNPSAGESAAPTLHEGASSDPDSAKLPAVTLPVAGIFRASLLLWAVVVAFAVVMSFVRLPRSAKAPRESPSKLLSRPIPEKDRMAMVPGGLYRMRAEAGVPPSVVLSTFYIDRYETTNNLYSEFCRRTGGRLPFGPESSYLGANPQYPVWNVSASDAEAYCASEGKRLPNDVEWLVAAGGVQAYLYPWGDEPAAGRANVGSGSLLPVGSSSGDISPFGVQDMAGNLPEYVRSDHDGGRHAVRGGGYYLPQDLTRLTIRFSFPEEIDASRGYARVGFRCVFEAGGSDPGAVRSPSEQQ